MLWCSKCFRLIDAQRKLDAQDCTVCGAGVCAEYVPDEIKMSCRRCGTRHSVLVLRMRDSVCPQCKETRFYRMTEES